MKNSRSNLRTLASLACLVLLVCTAAQAQSPSGTEKIENIKKLIQLQGGLDDVKQNVDRLIAAYCEKLPGLGPEYIESIKKAFDEKDLVVLTDKFVAAYDKHLTDEEISGLLRFYESPVGEKVTKAMPQITAEHNDFVKEWAQSSAIRVTDALVGLTRAVALGDTAKAEDALASGAEVNSQDPQGVTALMVAAINRNRDMAKLLIEKGADVNARTKRGLTPLMAAVVSGNIELVKFLLSKGADTNAKDELGFNAYQLAAMNKQQELVILLADKTTDRKPIRIGFVIKSLGKAKDCLPVMSFPSDSSRKITCLKPGQEVLPIGGIPTNNGWTLIQYPKVGWIPPESIEETAVSEGQRKKTASQSRDWTDSDAPADLSSTAESQTPDNVPNVETKTEPFIWWRR